MSAGSPTVYLLWATLSVIFLVFLLTHLWTYDKFQCIKWNTGKDQRAFKRLMTYTYLGSVPLLAIFSIGMARIKYNEGFMVVGGEIIPKPWEMWDERNKKWLLPLYFCLSGSWALEIVTHLEELTFWLFLLHQGPSQRQWFRSWEFRMWYLGSTLAVIGMPLTTLLTRQDLTTTLAWIFLVGSSAGTSTTICFFYVLCRFPRFIEHVKAEGTEPTVVVRLATFYQLNRIRVVFRFLFTIPLFIVAADGIQPPYLIVGNLFALDILLMAASIGSFVSSAITLFVFFPRSIAEESGYKIHERMPEASVGTYTYSIPARFSHLYHNQQVPKAVPSYGDAACIESRPISRSYSRYSYCIESGPIGLFPSGDTESNRATPQPTQSRIMAKRRSMPSRESAIQTEDAISGQRRCIARRHSDGSTQRGKGNNIMPLNPVIAIAPERRFSQIDRYLVNFTSPIDLPDDDDSDDRDTSLRSRAPP